MFDKALIENTKEKTRESQTMPIPHTKALALPIVRG